MGGNDTPAFGHARPSLALAAYAIAARPGRFRVGDGEIPAECNDVGVFQRPHPGANIASAPESRQRRVTDNRNIGSVAKGLFVVPEQLVDHVHIVG